MDSDHQLITTGPFRLVRHPIYSALLALWLGTALGTLNWLLLVMWPVYVVGVMKPAPQEERMLREKLGRAYQEYAQKRSRFVPGMW